MTQTNLDQHIASTFAKANVRFYHAENLRNLSTYCQARALLCRSELMKRDAVYYTQFYSDEADQALGVLTRVFGNIYDFGSIFARAAKTTPNVYGPITLVFRPTVFAEMLDIAITPQSIATHLADWTNVRVTEASVINEIASGDGYGSPVAGEWQMCELSCENAAISFTSLEKVLVEPIEVAGRRLIDYVRATAANLGVPIHERVYRRPENAAKLADLVALCEALPEGTENSDWKFSETQLPTSWSDLSEAKRKRMPGWCRYFYFGTLGECRLRDFIERMDEADDRTACELCDPGEDRPPAMVNYRPMDDGGVGSSALDVGYCDWCNGISVRCNECGAVRAVYEGEYDEVLDCDGGCGMRFRVVRTGSTDGGPSENVELVDETEDEAEDAEDNDDDDFADENADG